MSGVLTTGFLAPYLINLISKARIPRPRTKKLKVTLPALSGRAGPPRPRRQGFTTILLTTNVQLGVLCVASAKSSPLVSCL